MTEVELEDLSAAAKINDRLVAELKELGRPLGRERWIIRTLARFWKIAGNSTEEQESGH